MPCVFCGGELEARRVTFTHEQDGKYLVVKNVPAEVCTKAGERTYSAEVADELPRFAQREFKPVRKVPVFDFTKGRGRSCGSTRRWVRGRTRRISETA
ncbi:MAG: type II toxin-antitoxin system MqsA family antitoxin [Clostridia bacterium]|nr:type II toxin-antitoxin system MqsA family antitoxin [Clostridia bacterium]MDH7572544.1 type II toxin-antitoxin system MqsA family antitoxin [Clostridia bacterium]